MFGRMIADHAAASNVELGLATRSDHQTTLAFVRAKQNWNDRTAVHFWDLASLRERDSLPLEPHSWPLGLAHDGKVEQGAFVARAA